MDVEKVNQITERVLSSIQDSCPVVERNCCDIEGAWFKVVSDEKCSAHSYVQRVNRDILYVKVDSSCYLAVLKMKKGQILRRLREYGFHGIKDIKLQI